MTASQTSPVAAPAGPAPDAPIAAFCVFLAAAATLATGQLFGFLAFVPQLTERFGSAVKLGLPLFAAGYAVGMILLGSLAGRLGARRVLVVSLAAGGVLSLVTSLAPHVSVLLGLRFAEGLVLGGFPPAAFVASVQRVPQQKILFPNSAMVFGLLGSAGAAGLAARGLAATVGWRGGLVVFGLLLLVVAGVAAVQRGIAPGRPSPVHPYRLVGVELAGPEVLFSAACGMVTMATFVTTNGAAQKGPHPIAALLIVLGAVLTLLALAKLIVRRPADLRRIVGLVLTLAGAAVLHLSEDQVLVALALATVGATLTVPASIQQVVGNARKAIPVAVASFTCSLFVGGALAGLAVTGLVAIEPSTVTAVLLAGLALAGVGGVIRSAQSRRR
ncbi:hypothetical protein GCM10010168_51190 [Actinoplanes ianthinogenes]|uniref:Major facilitator superfamily (MFS) profile domain-containing protein n=1 Tax=Actinoplanes ianthinogenes TaxID=122358 RepID=A0ABN6CM81_9ACTN|nr:MFS transporter [Actinoplanes ianthinogenes]BCJ46170.1 hypothetical protein Aiant_68270 [Actinoplanes ianthinogenes]GGR26765.1 hypothetical protein GCM10010168_51190 [Actinoplanes ianthinogenes]